MKNISIPIRSRFFTAGRFLFILLLWIYHFLSTGTLYVLDFFVRRGSQLTRRFIIWQLAVLLVFILAAIIRKTTFSITSEYWLVFGMLLFVWCANLFATYYDSKLYAKKDEAPKKLYVPALNSILFVLITMGVSAFFLYYSVGVLNS